MNNQEKTDKLDAILHTQVRAYRTKMTVKDVICKLDPDEVSTVFESLAEGMIQDGRIEQ